MFKRFSQTLVYIPHFVSIVIVAALTYQLFSTTDGVAYHMLVQADIMYHKPLTWAR